WGAGGGACRRGRPQPGRVRGRCRRLALGLLHQPAAGRAVAVVRRRPPRGIGAARSAPARRWRRHGAADGGRGRAGAGHRAVGIAALEPWRAVDGGGRGAGVAGGLRGLGPQHAASAGRPGAVQASHLSLREPGHAQLRHCLRDDVLRFLLLHDGRLALQPAARRPGGHAGSAAGDADRDHHRQAGRAHGASAVPGGRRAGLCRQRPVVPAGARRRARLPGALAAGTAAERAGRGHGAALAGWRRGQPAAAAALCGGQRGQPGHAPDRRGAWRGVDGAAAGQGRAESRGFRPALHRPRRPGVADGLAMPCGGHAAASGAGPCL
ncbi:LOW QUALITY PROTEIN: major facilitator superfamily transporter MFS_1, partial [Achromobacter xylosoxidans C54]